MTDMAVQDRDSWQVPEHRVDAFGPKAHRHALVIPIINEGERFRNQLRRIAAGDYPVDIVIADGGSTDGSLDPAFLRDHKVRTLLTKTGPGKLSAQLRMAYAWCLREGYAGIVTVDGNGKDGVEAITAFCAHLDQGYDYVQGSRYRRGGAAINTPLSRTIGNRLIHAPLMSLAGRHLFTDTTNGFRAYSATYLRDPRVQPFRDIFNRYELLFYLTARAGQIGMKIVEIPVVRSYPRGQPIPTKIGGYRGEFSVLWQTLRTAFGEFRPGSEPF